MTYVRYVAVLYNFPPGRKTRWRIDEAEFPRGFDRAFARLGPHTGGAVVWHEKQPRIGRKPEKFQCRNSRGKMIGYSSGTLRWEQQKRCGEHNETLVFH